MMNLLAQLIGVITRCLDKFFLSYALMRLKIGSRISGVTEDGKANDKKKMSKQQLILRSVAVGLTIIVIGIFSFPSASQASLRTWTQTNWDGGVGSSTSSQYSSATNINASTSGEFELDSPEKLSNNSYDTNLDGWSTGSSEITPSVVETSVKAAAAATSHSLPLRNIPQTGNILVATIGFNTNPGTITMPTGWVLAVDSRINNSATLGRVSIYYKIVQAGDPTTIVVGNSVSSTVNFNVQELTGVDTTSPVDVTSTINSGAASTTTTAIPATAMTTRANAIALSGVLYVSSSAFTSWSNNFLNADGVISFGYNATKELTSKQTVSTTFTGVTARQNAGAIVVFKGALASQQNVALPGVIQSRATTTELSHTLTPDSVPQVGNLLVAAISFNGNPGTVTMPSGWTLSASVINPSEPRVYFYHRVVQAGDPRSFVVQTTTGIAATYTMHELSGIDPSNPVDVTSSVNSGAGTATTVAIPNTATTTTANSIAIARAGLSVTSAYTSWSNSFTNVNATTSYGYSATKVLSSTQQVSTTFTGVTAARTAGLIVVYKANGAATPTIVQTKNYLYAVATAFTASFTNPIKQGNTLFATFATRTNVGTITAPSGWTQVANAESASGRGTYLYIKTAGANEPLNHFFNFQYQVNGTISMYEVRGLVQGNTVDQSTTFANVSANPLTFSIPSTTQNRSFIFGTIGSSATTGFPTSWATNGFTTIYGMTAGEFQAGHKIQTTQAANNLSFANASLRILQGTLTAFNAGGSYVDASRNTGTKHSGAASSKITSSPWAISRYTQSVNVGDADSYDMTAYVYKDGSAVTSSDAQLFYDGASVSTTYTSAGSGWYKLAATITGANAVKDFGVEVPKNVTVYVDDFTVTRYETTGTLTSNIFDTTRLSNWGDIRHTSSGSGTVAVKVRSSNDPNMTGAPNFATCSAVASGVDISSGTNGCVTDAERYIQYQVVLTRGVGTTPVFSDLQIDYIGSDQTAPTSNASAIEMYKSNGGATIATNGWTNGNTPYFSWTAGIDNAGGIGIAGYCVYVGTDQTADPITTKGMLGTGDLDTENTCPFATANEYLDTSAVDILTTGLTTSDDAYYINIKAIDANNNVYTGSSESEHFRFDNTAPTNPSFINAPSNFIATKLTTMTWPTSNGSAPADDNSGVAGLQYRIGASGTWYGDDHTGDQDETDLLDNDGSYTTQTVPDFTDLQEGSNVVYFRTYDEAGNVSPGSVTTVLKINTEGAPSAPQNVTATPSINTANSFAFTWIAPATYVGNVNNLTYCYTINVTPTVNNCTYTNGGAMSIAAGPYATQPGVNTIYVVAKDESGSINYATAGTAEFTANTAAPGIPLNPDIADTSVRSTENWRLVVSWEPPDDVGAGVSSYEVQRSHDGVNFVRAGITGGSSYVDTSLDPEQYFYKVRACDSANNCGAYGEIVEKTPTGRYTTPPLMTSAGGVPRVSDLQTRSVKIGWATDRNADSKVAFGTTSGQYGSTEAYNSLQTTDHEISISNLTPGTTYYYVIKWTDADGNTGTSTELVFETLPPPTVEDVNAVSIGLTNATIQYTTTGAAATKLYYGKSSGFGSVIDASTSLTRSTYLTALKDLDDGTKYFYKINTIDASGFEYDGTTITFETPPAPKIANLRFQPVDGEPSSSQLVSWETNVMSTSELSYGILGGETLTSLDVALTTKHEVIIRNLVDDSTYTLIARSRDENANLATSDSQTFKTALDTRPPKVSDVTVVASIRGSGAEARGQVIVSWKTDELASSQVAYGEGTAGDLSNSSAQDGRLTLDHSVVISDLSTSKVYSIQAISLDKGDNKAVSERQSAIIGRGTESALGIIFAVLQKIFGVGK